MYIKGTWARPSSFRVSKSYQRTRTGSPARLERRPRARSSASFRRARRVEMPKKRRASGRNKPAGARGHVRLRTRTLARARRLERARDGRERPALGLSPIAVAARLARGRVDDDDARRGARRARDETMDRYRLAMNRLAGERGRGGRRTTDGRSRCGSIVIAQPSVGLGEGGGARGEG